MESGEVSGSGREPAVLGQAVARDVWPCGHVISAFTGRAIRGDVASGAGRAPSRGGAVLDIPHFPRTPAGDSAAVREAPERRPMGVRFGDIGGADAGGARSRDTPGAVIRK
ncbi:hypothetical protein Skr01_06310 [Sphaerisporangium krabiense]|nr:hypothetical protein Skr01_06310 [Sphaerisporangium krabiense]